MLLNLKLSIWELLKGLFFIEIDTFKNCFRGIFLKFYGWLQIPIDFEVDFISDFTHHHAKKLDHSCDIKNKSSKWMIV